MGSNQSLEKQTRGVDFPFSLSLNFAPISLAPRINSVIRCIYDYEVFLFISGFNLILRSILSYIKIAILAYFSCYVFLPYIYSQSIIDFICKSTFRISKFSKFAYYKVHVKINSFCLLATYNRK